MEEMELRFVGKEVRPDTTELGEVAQLLRAADSAMRIIIDEYALNTTTADTEIYLNGVEAGSLRLRMSTRHPFVTEGFAVLAHAVQTADYDYLPQKAIHHLQVLHRFSKVRSCSLEFRLPQQSPEPIAWLLPGAIIEPAPRMRGETELYGEIMRLGGDAPCIDLRCFDGTEVCCTATKEQVQALGARLYQVVGLRGAAQWEVGSYRVVAFAVAEILSYDPQAADPIAELSRTFGAYFDAITDVDAYVRELRGYDEEGAEV